MSGREVKIGQFSCNCNALQVMPDQSLLLLLVCGDQESYVSRIVRLLPDLSAFVEIITIDTWILSAHFDRIRETMLCSTAGGRLLEIHSGRPSIVFEDVPFISGFRSLPDGRLLAFGWHGLVLEHDRVWTRLETGDKRRIFDLRAYRGEVFICGDSGLFGRLGANGAEDLGLPTNARLRRLCSREKSLIILSQAPMIFRFSGEGISVEDVELAPAWDAVEHKKEVWVGGGYEGLYRYYDPGLKKASTRHAFRMAVWGEKLAVLAESSLWLWQQEPEEEIQLFEQYKDMLENYRLV